jgi:hypothetical protein
VLRSGQHHPAPCTGRQDGPTGGGGRARSEKLQGM